MGFDRVFIPTDDLEEAALLLAADIAARGTPAGSEEGRPWARS